ncbi:hypothetical protein KSP40_PGU007593 [Platanthera guangdongensis]|uniref:WEB family protein n=1 Tax=Platanthera guangdongensis TaxID=2320717 RepID=A0ABR2MU64_9ASPA
MQGFRSRPGSSEIHQKSSPSTPNPKRSPSPKITRSSSVSSDSMDSRVSRVPERKPSPMSQSSQEKQRHMRVSETQQQLAHALEDLKRAKEERSQALEELKKRDEESTRIRDTVTALKIEAEKSKEAEMKMLESLASQTKQLEQTMILLEEAKLEIRNLREIPGSLEKKGLLASVQTIQAQEEIRKLRYELRLAMEAEEKGKKAMDDFAIALKEVTTEATQLKEELAAAKSEAEKARAESELSDSSLREAKQKLLEITAVYDKLKMEHEESSIAWNAKQDSFMNCMMISEEDMEKKDEEISRLAEAHNTAKEENSKLRDIIKQAVNEAMVVKESLEIARSENYELKEQFSEKESAFEKTRQENQSLKDREAAALDSVRKLKGLLASTIASDLKRDLNVSDVEASKQPSKLTTDDRKVTTDDRKVSRNVKKFPSDRWVANDNIRFQNGSRHSVEGSETFENFAFDREGAFDSLEGILAHGVDNGNRKKKKTVFGRFGDALRRRSFRKT